MENERMMSSYSRYSPERPERPMSSSGRDGKTGTVTAGLTVMTKRSATASAFMRNSMSSRFCCQCICFSSDPQTGNKKRPSGLVFHNLCFCEDFFHLIHDLIHGVIRLYQISFDVQLLGLGLVCGVVKVGKDHDEDLFPGIRRPDLPKRLKPRFYRQQDVKQNEVRLYFLEFLHDHAAVFYKR